MNFCEKHKLVTLWDMLEFAADKFVRAREGLAKLELILAATRNADQQKVVSPSGAALSMPGLVQLRQQALELGCLISVKAIEKAQGVAQSGKSASELHLALFHVTETVHDELASVLLLEVPPSSREMFEAKRLFGSDVADKFARAGVDIEEAGKCFALERYTSCVFHLMRVMERGLRVFAESLNDPTFDPTKHPSWREILKRCDEELKKPRDKRAPQWQTDEHFFSEATAKLWAVKDAWRNSTMHVELTYTEEQAKDVFNAVKGFMRTLATKLDDRDPITKELLG